jgi:hypothetical protein
MLPTDCLCDVLRHAAQRPQCVLQAFRERHKTLAAEHHMGMLEARQRQPEVVQQSFESSARLSPVIRTMAPFVGAFALSITALVRDKRKAEPSLACAFS